MASTLTTEPAGLRPAGSVGSPTPGGPGDDEGTGTSRMVWRLRLTTVCIALTALALSQAPGRLVADTKLDLVVDPLAFLARALGLWESEGFAGQVQNQAYGYLFPMGPFFALGQATGLPMWMVQRLWWALLLCAAFLGVVFLVRRLRMGPPVAAVVAGLAYALAPRMVSLLGGVSIEVLPMALAPWVLLPLVGAERSGSARRAAALSGLAVFCVGGVNAVATAAVLPLPVLYLLTRPPGFFRRRLIAWWGASVVLATSWWAVPLVLLGRYSPPFLDFIETAGTTTTPTDLTSVLRGTSHWVAYLATPIGPQWPAGWALARELLPVAGTVVLAAAGLFALTRRGLPERTWLVLGLLSGVVLVSLGHLAPVQGLLADPLHDALDGVLAPLRNVHKFEPVLRLPLALALAHLVSVLLRGAAGPWPAYPRRPAWWGEGVRNGSRAALAALGLALVVTAAPAVGGRMAPPGSFQDIPVHWQEAADYLADARPSGRALLVPGSSFGTYAWGTTNDEPLQALADSPWEVRNAVPLTPAAHIRMLDTVEERLARGEGSVGLTRYLARAGISHLVLRNDLDVGLAASTRSELVRQALRDSPGIRRVAGFGPDFPQATPTEGLLYDAGLQEPRPAVEIFAVTDTAPRAWTAPLSDAVTVHGGPDAVLELEDRGLLTDRPTVLAGDAGAGTGHVMVGDALVRRERTFGRVTAAESAGLAADDPLRLSGTVPDFPVSGGAAQSVVRYGGGTPSAASSASDPGNVGGARPGSSPWAAVDGDPRTAWRPALQAGTPSPVWWRLDTDRAFLASTVTVTLDRSGEEQPARVRLTTDAGAFTVALADSDDPQRLPLPPGRTSTLTIAPIPTDDDAGALALAEVELPGVAVTRSVVTPVPGEQVDVYAFDAANPGVAGCLVRDDGPRCAGTLVQDAEEPQGLDRVLTVARPAAHDLEVTAVPRPGPALDALLAAAHGDEVGVVASSSAVDDPRASARAAVDGDPSTSWLAAGDDESPTLELSWPEPRTFDSLRVVTTPGVPAAVATAVTLDVGGLPQLLSLDYDGSVRFPAITTDRLVVGLTLPLEADSFDPYTFRTDRLGVGVSELQIGGENPAPDAGAPVPIPCGSGPVVTVDGEPVETSADTTLGELTALAPLRLEPCGNGAALRLAAGEHRLVAASTDVLTVDSATLTRAGSGVDDTRPGRRAAQVVRWDDEHRRVEVGERDEPTLLVVPENTNAGWTASIGGRALETVAVDGWQQGYVLPPGAATTVDLDFGPGAVYRSALAAGAGAVLLLVVLGAVPARRQRPLAARRSSRIATAALVLAAAGGIALVGGVVGILALGALYAVGRAAGTAGRQVLGGTAALAPAIAGALLLILPDGTATARQVLALVAVAAVVAGVLPGTPGRLRMSGARRAAAG
ncbi:alpha-(1-_3)-arabinofuranosyltransferase domain-containing protein [Blastococcus atacamensis]|uniref:alpha-(1->3)-arabinofuranosyltransferase domain-containing protein n=1 Tax=Blastococcus atacamensis TaxID=2070508 RepID=UPI000CECA758|nr:alpha-(1->3)-arabinofuranosyltransferase family protein [Blastococcus atacamensis]